MRISTIASITFIFEVKTLWPNALLKNSPRDIVILCRLVTSSLWNDYRTHPLSHFRWAIGIRGAWCPRSSCLVQVGIWHVESLFRTNSWNQFFDRYREKYVSPMNKKSQKWWLTILNNDKKNDFFSWNIITKQGLSLNDFIDMTSLWGQLGVKFSLSCLGQNVEVTGLWWLWYDITSNLWAVKTNYVSNIWMIPIAFIYL